MVFTISRNSRFPTVPVLECSKPVAEELGHKASCTFVDRRVESEETFVGLMG